MSESMTLAERLRGLVRMGERRWDLVLDRDQRILLPEDGAVEALERVIALDEAQDILSRDILQVDLRRKTEMTFDTGTRRCDDRDFEYLVRQRLIEAKERGEDVDIGKIREEIKQQTIAKRRLQHQAAAA